MKSILFINGCIRGKKSRTLEIANAFFEEIEKCEDVVIEVVDLNELKPQPLFEDTLEAREGMNGNWEDEQFAIANQFKEADVIVIAAPCWQGTFPAAVHAYMEQVCIAGLTFDAGPKGYAGYCKAQQAIFMTTCGGIYERGKNVIDYFGDCLLASTLKMIGVKKFETVLAHGVDIIGYDVENAMMEAKEKAVACARLV